MYRKSSSVLLILTLCLILAFTSFYALAHNVYSKGRLSYASFDSQLSSPNNPVVSSFSSALVMISEESFAGTALESVFLPESIVSIQSRAFAEIPSLYSIYMPRAIHSIADDALGSRNDIQIICAPDSYANRWAHERGLPVLLLDIWMYDSSSEIRRRILLAIQLIALQFLLAFSIQAMDGCRIPTLFLRFRDFWSQRPQDRSELHAIEYRFP